MIGQKLVRFAATGSGTRAVPINEASEKWRQRSGRTDGPDSYVPGDFTRAVFRTALGQTHKERDEVYQGPAILVGVMEARNIGRVGPKALPPNTWCTVVPLDADGKEIESEKRRTRTLAGEAVTWDEAFAVCTKTDLSRVASLRIKLKQYDGKWRSSEKLGEVDIPLDASTQLLSDANLARYHDAWYDLHSPAAGGGGSNRHVGGGDDSPADAAADGAASAIGGGGGGASGGRPLSMGKRMSLFMGAATGALASSLRKGPLSSAPPADRPLAIEEGTGREGDGEDGASGGGAPAATGSGSVTPAAGRSRASTGSGHFWSALTPQSSTTGMASDASGSSSARPRSFTAGGTGIGGALSPSASADTLSVLSEPQALVTTTGGAPAQVRVWLLIHRPPPDPVPVAVHVRVLEARALLEPAGADLHSPSGTAGGHHHAPSLPPAASAAAAVASVLDSYVEVRPRVRMNERTLDASGRAAQLRTAVVEASADPHWNEGVLLWDCDKPGGPPTPQQLHDAVPVQYRCTTAAAGGGSATSGDAGASLRASTPFAAAAIGAASGGGGASSPSTPRGSVATVVDFNGAGRGGGGGPASASTGRSGSTVGLSPWSEFDASGGAFLPGGGGIGSAGASPVSAVASALTAAVASPSSSPSLASPLDSADGGAPSPGGGSASASGGLRPPSSRASRIAAAAGGGSGAGPTSPGPSPPKAAAPAPAAPPPPSPVTVSRSQSLGVHLATTRYIEFAVVRRHQIHKRNSTALLQTGSSGGSVPSLVLPTGIAASSGGVPPPPPMAAQPALAAATAADSSSTGSSSSSGGPLTGARLTSIAESVASTVSSSLSQGYDTLRQEVLHHDTALGCAQVSFSDLFGDEDAVLCERSLHVHRWFRLRPHEGMDVSLEGALGHIRLAITLVYDTQLLPPGWQEATDTETNETYFYNTVTGVSQWEEPPDLLAHFSGETVTGGSGRRGSTVAVDTGYGFDAVGLVDDDEDGGSVAGRGSPFTGTGSGRSRASSLVTTAPLDAAIVGTAPSSNASVGATLLLSGGGAIGGTSSGIASSGATGAAGGPAAGGAGSGRRMEARYRRGTMDALMAATVTAQAAAALATVSSSSSPGSAAGANGGLTAIGEDEDEVAAEPAPAASAATAASPSSRKPAVASAVSAAADERDGGDDEDADVAYDAEVVAKAIASHDPFAAAGKKAASRAPAGWVNPLAAAGAASGGAAGASGEGAGGAAAAMAAAGTTSDARMKAMADAMAKDKAAKKAAEDAVLAAKLAAMSPEERAEFEAGKAREARMEQRKNRMLQAQLNAYGAAPATKRQSIAAGRGRGRGK